MAPLKREILCSPLPPKTIATDPPLFSPSIVSLPDISTCAEGLHESLGSRLCDGAEVVDEVSLGHPDTGVLDGEGVVCLFTTQRKTENE